MQLIIAILDDAIGVVILATLAESLSLWWTLLVIVAILMCTVMRWWLGVERWEPYVRAGERGPARGRERGVLLVGSFASASVSYTHLTLPTTPYV